MTVLPAESVEILLRILREIQLRLRVVLLQLNDAHHDNLDGIADAGILVEGRDHVHDGQQVADHILVECRHGCIGHNQCLHVPRTADRAAAAISVQPKLLPFPFPFPFLFPLLLRFVLELALPLLLLVMVVLVLLLVMVIVASHLAAALYLQLATRLPLQARFHAATWLSCAAIALLATAAAAAAATLILAAMVLVASPRGTSLSYLLLGLHRGALEHHVRVAIDGMCRIMLGWLYVILILGRLDVTHLSQKERKRERERDAENKRLRQQT